MTTGTEPQPATNAILPAVILFGALLLTIFSPYMVVFAFFAMIWLMLVVRKRQQQIDLGIEQLSRLHDESRAQALRADALDAIIAASDIPIIATDPHGVITVANPAAHTILSPGRALASSAFDVLFTHTPVLNLAAHVLAGESGHARFSLPIHGQQREFDVAGDPIVNGQGGVFTFRDITELTTAVSLKADFAANASHELRTPIASIRGAVDTLAGPAHNEEPMRTRLIEMISNNALRLELLVHDLLDLSKLESTDAPPVIESVDVGALIEQINDQFVTICARRHVTIETQIEPGVRTLRTDRSLLALIVRNLIENATKFAHEHTTITIHLRPDEGIHPGKPASVESQRRNGGVQLRVIDRGAGIPLGDQKRIFERFYQVDDARSGSTVIRGTGLGLAIVKHACKRLGGTIDVESVLGQGTTMNVHLPRCVDCSSADLEDKRDF